MRIRSVLALLAVCMLFAACSVGGLFKAYEYEEEMYLSLDGTATVYVNSSIAALNALRGTSFDTDPAIAHRPRRGTRRLRLAEHARQPRHAVAAEQPALRPRPLDGGQHRRAGRRAALRMVHLQVPADGELFNYRQTRRRSGSDGVRRRRLEGKRDRRVSSAPAEQDCVSQRRARQSAAREHPVVGTAAGRPATRHSADARRAEWNRSRFCIARWRCLVSP